MKRQFMRFSFILITALMLTSVPVFVMAGSAGDNVSQMIYYLRQGNVSQAQTYNQRLPETAKRESCVRNMSKAMKAAYRKEVKAWEDVTQYGNYVFYDYWLTDIDNDGSAELLLDLAPDYASAATHVYKYQGGQLKEIGTFSGNEIPHAYPSHNGLVTEGGKMGYNWLTLITIEDGNLVTDQLITYGDGNLDQYFNMRNRLRSHAKWNGERYVPDYDDLRAEKVKATSITKLKKGRKSITVKWKKRSKVTGYQIQYGTNSKFRGAKKIKVKKASATSKTIRKLKAKKKYYVRVRAYKKVKGKTYYSRWSKKKAVKTR